MITPKNAVLILALLEFVLAIYEASEQNTGSAVLAAILASVFFLWYKWLCGVTKK